MIPDTLHALLAQRINNAAQATRSPAEIEAVAGGAGNRSPPGGDAFPVTPCASATRMRKGKLREMAEALLH